MSALTPPTDMPTPTTDKITQAAMETIYLCKFRVSMDGEWLCLRELDDISLTPDPEPTHEGTVRPQLFVSTALRGGLIVSGLGGSEEGRSPSWLFLLSRAQLPCTPAPPRPCLCLLGKGFFPSPLRSPFCTCLCSVIVLCLKALQREQLRSLKHWLLTDRERAIYCVPSLKYYRD